MKASYFNISTPLIKENFRRFWALPLVAFLGYLISGVCPILINYNNPADLTLFITSLLSNVYSAYWLINLLVPVIASVLVFRYSHSNSSATAMHAMPFTRSKLFNSSLLSGFVLSIIPIVLIGIILLCLIPTLSSPSTVEIFTGGKIFTWIWQQLLLAFCVYVISIFAAVITGSGIIHFFTALWFNFLAVTFYLMLGGYYGAFLYGYSSESTDVGIYFSPFTGILYGEGKISAMVVICYFALGLGLVILSSLLYHKRRLERAGRSFVFTFMVPVIWYLLAFYAMTMVGIIFYLINDNLSSMYMGLIGGGITAFIISRMIVKKTFKVFDITFLKNFAIYTVIVVLLITTLAFDLTGYETRVPRKSQVASVGFDTFSGLTNGSRFESQYYKGTAFVCKEKANIEAILHLHREIVKIRPDEGQTKQREQEDVIGNNLSLDYRLNNGFNLSRNYDTLKDSFIKNSPYIKTIYKSEEFKDFYSLMNLKLPKKSKVAIDSPFSKSQINLRKSEYEQLFIALDKDFRARTYEQEMATESPYATVNLSIPIVSQEEVYFDDIYFDIKYSDTHTMKWLKDHGYYKTLEVKLNEIDSVVIVPNSDDLDLDEYLHESGVVIKDRKQIETILATFNTVDGPYLCIFNFKRTSELYDPNPEYYFLKNPLPSFLKGKF